MFDFSHPAFRPLWLRLAVVAVALGWALFEALTGGLVWAMVFGALGTAAAWGLLIAYEPPPPASDKPASDKPASDPASKKEDKP